MATQFTLRRLMFLVVIVAVVCSLFATLDWSWAMLLLAGMNAFASLSFTIVKRVRLSSLAGMTSSIILVTLVCTVGFAITVPLNYPPVIRVWWAWWTPAFILELATVLCWLFSGSPSVAAKQ
jgi:hypothetical protein